MTIKEWFYGKEIYDDAGEVVIDVCGENPYHAPLIKEETK